MYYFIVNPASKTGVGAKYWNRVEKVLKERNIAYQVRFSKAAGQVEEIVRKLIKETKEKLIHLVILGGDGTVNEAVQGIEDFEKVNLSYIPTGSSNDLARDMGISKNPEANCRFPGRTQASQPRCHSSIWCCPESPPWSGWADRSHRGW